MQSKWFLAFLIFCVVLFLMSKAADIYTQYFIHFSSTTIVISLLVAAVISLVAVIMFERKEKNEKSIKMNDMNIINEVNKEDMEIIKDISSTQADYPVDIDLDEDFTYVDDDLDELAEDRFVNWNIFQKFLLDDNFIKKYTHSLKSSYKKKMKRYYEIKESLEKENSGQSIRSAIDLEKFNPKVLENVNNIIVLIRKRLQELSHKNVKKNLLSAVEETNKIVGREEVKDMIAEQLYNFSKSPDDFIKNFQNIIIMGPSGVGKTLLSKTMSKIYSLSGILLKNDYRFYTASDLTSPYVNFSDTKTRELLMENLEGVIFIDEAYGLTPIRHIGGTDHSSQSITEMVNFLDQYRGLSVLILGGYEEEMKEFLKSNDGLPRRFVYNLVLENYSVEELCLICENHLRSNGMILGENQRKFLREMIRKRHELEPDLFDKQAADMIELANNIIRTKNILLDFDMRRDYTFIVNKSIENLSKNKVKIN